MIDVEPLIEDAFARLYPLPAPQPGWDEVLAEAGVRPRRRRTIMLVAVAVMTAALLTAAALGQPLWSFPDWLSGHPGNPAAPSAQQSFARENARSWAGFPTGTNLRQLIHTRKDGVDYSLYGFRSGDELCLRLVVSGAATGKQLSCAPLSDLRSRPAPALPIQVDTGFGTIPGKHVRIGIDTYGSARANASFGIVADGVRAVRLRSDDRTRQALVAHDAFLSVVDKPRTGIRVHAISATTTSGRTYQVPVASAPFDTLNSVTAPTGTLHGPTRIQRRVHGGTIGWLDHHQPVGKPLAAGLPLPLGHVVERRLVYGRLIQPDPLSPLRVAVVLYDVRRAPGYTLMKPGPELCETLVVARGGGSGCDPLEDAFQRSPFTMGMFTGNGGDQYSVLSGIASDDVATLRLFLGDGGIAQVPLRDNTFAILVSRARFPIRLAAYDRAGHVIGLQSMRGEGAVPDWQKPDPHASWKLLIRIHDAQGKPATLWTKRSLAGTTCFALRTARSNGNGCNPPRWQGQPMQAGLMGTVIEGRVRNDITHIEIHYRTGPPQTAKPRHGFILAAIRRHATVVEIDGYNANGRQVGRFRPLRP